MGSAPRRIDGRVRFGRKQSAVPHELRGDARVRTGMLIAPLAAVVSFLLAPAQREPVPVHPTPLEVIEVLRSEPPLSTAFAESIQRLPELLARPESEVVEGAAFLAGEYRRSECREALLSVVNGAHRGASDESSRAHDLAFDALIRIGEPLPEDVVFAARRRTSDHGMVLAALLLEPDRWRRNTNLRRLVVLEARSSPARWAAATLLALDRYPDLAAVLATGAKWPLEVKVVDAGLGALGSSVSTRRLAATRCRFSAIAPWDIWPPLVEYALSLPEAGAPLTSPTVIRSVRARELPETLVSASSRIAPGDELAWRLRLLEYLAPGHGTIEPSEFELSTCAYSSRELEWLIAERVEVLSMRLRQLEPALREQGLLGETPAWSAQLRWDVDVSDQRADRSTKLELPKEWPGVFIR